MKTTEKNTQLRAESTMGNSQHLSDIAIAEQAAALVKADDGLRPEIKNRLSQGRELAVNRMLKLQAESQWEFSGSVLQKLGDFSSIFMPHRAVTLALLMMLVTFFTIQQMGLNDNIENSDAYLLASDLPPEAFADKGFNTWVVSARN